MEDHTIVVRYKSSEVHNALQNTLPQLSTTCTVHTKRYEGEEMRHTKSLQHFMNQMTKECQQPECEAHLGRRRSEGLRLVSSPLSRPVEEVFFCVGP